jgi:iron(III) transport system substrate-binding protein
MIRILLGLALLAALPALAAAPGPTAATPELLAAARKEGKVVFYTSIELQVAEKVARAFEAAHPGVTVQVERNGAERLFQRIGQEYASNIRAVDVFESSDATHFMVWKKEGWLVPFVPADVAKWPADRRDPDGQFAAVRFTLSVMAYNTKLLKPEELPKGFRDLLDPKWNGKVVKAHPGYSGTIMTATYQMSRDLGWDYFEKLGKQKVMQVQSAAEPPKKVAVGERPIMADGAEYTVLHMRESGAPIEVIYPSEGAPQIVGQAAVAKHAPNPNAARLLAIWLFSREAQQLMSDIGATRSFHPEVKLREGRKPLGEIKLMRPDAEAQEKLVEDIRQKYARYFGI